MDLEEIVELFEMSCDGRKFASEIKYLRAYLAALHLNACSPRPLISMLMGKDGWGFRGKKCLQVWNDSRKVALSSSDIDIEGAGGIASVLCGS